MNKMEHEGKTYVAEASDEACHAADGSGRACAFDSGLLKHVCRHASCCPGDDGTDNGYIIWVEEATVD